MSLVTQGLGPGGGAGPGTTSYVMRAFHTVFPTGHVYWTVVGAPDPTASFAPYPAVDLTDIVVIREFIPA